MSIDCLKLGECGTLILRVIHGWAARATRQTRVLHEEISLFQARWVRIAESQDCTAETNCPGVIAIDDEETLERMIA